MLLGKFHLALLPFFGIFLFLVVGCTPTDQPEPLAPDLGVTLTPYWIAAREPADSPEPALSPSPPLPTVVSTPAPTPLVYTIVPDDTLTGIAFRYSVSLEELLAANPGIDPNFLTIGMTLTIPMKGLAVVTQPTPSPVPVTVQPPVCYPLGDGQMQCLSLLINDHPVALENLAVQITLPFADGSSASVVAVPPLNLLPAGEQIVVSARFDTISDLPPQAAVLSAIPIISETQRYLPAELQLQEVSIAPDGLHARVNGTLFLPENQPDAMTIWVAALAYDEDEKIAGIRKWVAGDTLPAGGQVNFRFQVYSLGPPIARVKLLTEVRP